MYRIVKARKFSPQTFLWEVEGLLAQARETGACG
jgi:hypothetical protein